MSKLYEIPQNTSVGVFMTALLFILANGDNFGILEYFEEILKEMIESFALSFGDTLANSLAEFVYAIFERMINEIFGGLMIGGVLLGILGLVLPILGALSLGVLIALLIVTLIKYLITAIGVTRVAKKLGVRGRILAWIPVCNIFIVGKCTEHARKRKGKKSPPWGWLLLIGILLSVVAPFVIQLCFEVFSWLMLVVAAVFPVAPIIVELAQILVTILLFSIIPLYYALFSFCTYLVYREFMSTPASIFWTLLTFFFNLYGFVFFIVGFMKLKPVEQASAPNNSAEFTESAANVESTEPEVLEPDRIE